MRALIVDDEYICRRLLQEMLKPYGSSEPVGSGEEAVTAYTLALDENKAFDLVLLDIEMPGIDGFETLKRIRQVEATRGLVGRKAAKVIMTTVRKDPESVFSSFRHQCEAYLIKPVTPESLVVNLRHFRLIPAEGATGA
jgi:two-component system chemotaxis response regulator CheY